MTKYEVTQDHEACIGCGHCVDVCDKNWKMEKDGKAAPIKKLSDAPCNVQAEKECPVTCIHVKAIK